MSRLTPEVTVQANYGSSEDKGFGKGQGKNRSPIQILKLNILIQKTDSCELLYILLSIKIYYIKYKSQIY